MGPEQLKAAFYRAAAALDMSRIPEAMTKVSSEARGFVSWLFNMTQKLFQQILSKMLRKSSPSRLESTEAVFWQLNKSLSSQN